MKIKLGVMGSAEQAPATTGVTLQADGGWVAEFVVRIESGFEVQCERNAFPDRSA